MLNNKIAVDTKYYPLTTQQRGMWNIETVYPGTGVGIISGTVFQKGFMDLDLLERAIHLCIHSNDSFQLRVTLDKNEPVQYLGKYCYQKLERQWFENHEQLDQWDHTNTSTTFGLTDNRLYYFGLFSLTDQKSGFYFKLHHLICDAWTIVIMTNQIIDYYNKLQEGLPDEPVYQPSYIDFISKEEEYFSSKVFEANKAFWNERFETYPKFNLIKPYVGMNSVRANRKTFLLSKTLTQQVYHFCEAYKATPFAFFIAVLDLYLSKFTAKDDIVIGSPILNRSNAKDKNTTGMFINIIPMRFAIDGTQTFSEFVTYIGKEIRQYLKNQKYPYDLILQDFKKKHQSDKIYDVVFSYQNSKLNRDIVSDEYDNHWDFNGYQTESLCIHVDDRNSTGEYVFNFDYLADAFEADEIDRIYEYFTNLIQETTATPEGSLGEISLLSKEQRSEILFGFNDNKIQYPRKQLFHQIFEEHAGRYPEKIAVLCGDVSISYGALNQKANALAALLRKKGVGPEKIVGLMTGRTAEAIIGIFAILKAGGAYLPIDPSYPEDRIQYILDNSGLSVLLTDQSSKKQLDCDTLFLDNPDAFLGDGANLAPAASPESLMYVIYTSGSTGNPKGVMIENCHFLNMAYAWRKDYRLDSFPVTLLQLASFSFDVFSGDLARVFLNGGTMVIATEQEKYNYAILGKMIGERSISIFESTPQLVLPLMEHVYTGQLPVDSMKLLIVGSDTCANQDFRKLTERFGARMRVVNSYGVTEATIDSSYYEATLEEIPRVGSTSIGKPLGNVSMYVLGAGFEVKPVGVVGELYLSGESVARGYYNNAALTNEKFFDNPFVAGQKIYKTGDLAKWLPDGNMAFLGRADTQVKIKGFRIELGEIEAKLLGIDGIEEAVVLADQNVLKAFYVSSGVVDSGDIKQQLHQILPHYMVPSRFIRLERFPLSPNGKVDKKAILKLQEDDICSAGDYVAPSCDTEFILCGLWEDAIQKGRVGICDNFFDIGGDSLAAIQILSVAYHQNWSLSIQDFYKYQTVREMAQFIDERRDEGFSEEAARILGEVPYKHDITNLEVTKTPNRLQNVLLTGATGFLGIHILREILSTTAGTVFCLVRDHGEKLSELLKFYFDGDDILLWNNRILPVCGDIRRTSLGLSDADTAWLDEKIDTVIHAAAIVKHYGSEKEFESTNVFGTKEVIRFCEEKGKRLLYISTTSVSGDTLRQDRVLSFCENDFYIGQNYRDNIYIRSKFNAENLVLKAIEKGLNATVFRVGNLTGRYLDGVFQKNIRDNMFYNMLKSIIEIGAIPRALLNMRLELTSVDLCAKAILRILGAEESSQRVFHVLNPHTATLQMLMKLLGQMGYRIDCLEHDHFIQHVNRADGRAVEGQSALLLVNDYNFEKFMDKHYNVNVSGRITNGYLAALDFQWPAVDENYLLRILGHIDAVGFIRQPAMSEINKIY